VRDNYRAVSLTAAKKLNGMAHPRPRVSKRRIDNAVTKIVMLGTGTPGPDPDRSGPATAIVVNDTPYLVDFGPGIVRRAAAAYQNGMKALGFGATNLKTIFLTHLHADHTAGYPDLILTPWIMGRRKPLDVYGPTGLKAMTKHVIKAWELDIANRIHGPERLKTEGSRVNAREIKPGIIYKDRNVTVTAFPVRHGEMNGAFGFRFDTPDKTIVISGDTAPTEAIIENSCGCDILIHEAYSQETYGKVSRKWRAYRRKHHTSSKQLAALARRAKPALLILYHRANPGGERLPDPEQVLLDEIRQLYEGEVVTGHDLDVF
jgi:ribonuclease BN (tRNA processing enzyme)